MVHKESIGRVVGDAGKTYIPTISSKNDGTFNITFTANDTNENNEEVVSPDIVVPYIVPYKDENEQKIKFRLELNALPNNVELPEISFDDIRGLQGEHGALSIEFIDDIRNFNINEKDANNEYVHNKDVIYIDTSDIEGLQDSIDAYVIYEENGERQIVKINSIINLSNYYTKDQVDTELANITNYINYELTNVVGEQQAINSILTNGITIEDSDYTISDNVVNVMSDASIEDVRSQILEELRDYIKESDIVFDSETGTINIKY